MKRRPILTLLIVAVALGSIRAQDEKKPLRIDTNHSTIGFEVPIVGDLSEVTGKFTDFDIVLHWDEEEPANSSVSTTIQVASVDTGIDDRDADLRSPNFFDAATNPTITFVSDSIAGSGEDYVANGTLMMNGVSRDIVLPFRMIERDQDDGGKWYAFQVEYVLDRTDYGITWEHSILPFFVGNDITVKLFVITR